MLQPAVYPTAETAERPQLCQGIAGSHLVDVGAAHKGLLPGARHDQNPHFLICLGLIDGLRHLAHQRLGQRVAHLRPVDGYRRDSLALFIHDVLIFHLFHLYYFTCYYSLFCLLHARFTKHKAFYHKTETIIRAERTTQKRAKG